MAAEQAGLTAPEVGTTGDWTVWVDQRFDLGEGPRLVSGRPGAADAEAVMVDLLAGRLLRLPMAAPGEPEELASLDVPLGAAAPLRGRPEWIVAAGPGVALLDPAGGLDWIARPEDGAPQPMRMNDAACDPGGRFWAGSMALDGSPGLGSLYRIDADGSLHRVVEGLDIPNGPAFSLDGTRMYLADSPRGIIDTFPVDPVTGDLGERRRFADVDSGSPDGMTVDDEGCLWVAVWGGAEIRRYSPDGRVLARVPVPAVQPTSVCLIGGGRMLVTSAAVGLDVAPARHDGRVLVTRVGVTAPPAREFTLRRR